MKNRLISLKPVRDLLQSQPISPGQPSAMSGGRNTGGVDPWERFLRFLVLGAEGNTYTVCEQRLSRENAENATRCLEMDHYRFVDTIVTAAASGRVYKTDPILFSLALAASANDPAARACALDSLPQVARTATQLFHFARFVDGLRGWGRGLRQSVARWYQDKPETELSFQLAKYKERDGWSHCDLLRLAHPVPDTPTRAALFRWATGKEVNIEDLTGLAQAQERLKHTSEQQVAAAIIRESHAPREIVPTEFLIYPSVWEALLPNLGMTALLRNLGNMSKVGLLDGSNSTAMNHVVNRITDPKGLREEHIHPLQVLAALCTYQQGRGVLSSGRWRPAAQIVDALNDAYSATIQNIQPINKRIYYGLDISGSMSVGQVCGIPGMTPRLAMAALAMGALRTEPDCILRGFQEKMVPLNINPQMSLSETVQSISNLSFGRTDCAQPILDASQTELAIDAFVIYTDSETWYGSNHPAQALTRYRQKTGIPAQMVVVGMTSNRFTIADRNDAGMLDVIGFSTSTPYAISDFIAGRLGQPTPPLN